MNLILKLSIATFNLPLDVRCENKIGIWVETRMKKVFCSCQMDFSRNLIFLFPFR